MRILQAAIAGGVLLLGAVGTFAVGQMDQLPMQQTPTPRNPQMPSIDGRNANDTGTLAPSILARQAKMRNDARQQQLVNDTNKLVELATQLKQEMDKSGKDVDQDDVAKKAAEIEKLAKNVKDRMKG